MSATSVVVGIDVAKAYVDVAVLGGEFAAQRFENEAEGHSALAAALQPLGAALVVMEATGGYEAALACACRPRACRWRWSIRSRRAIRQGDGTLGQDRPHRRGMLAELAAVLLQRDDLARYLPPLPASTLYCCRVTRRRHG